MKLPWKFRLSQAWEILVHGTDTRYETCLDALRDEGMAHAQTQSMLKFRHGAMT